VLEIISIGIIVAITALIVRARGTVIDRVQLDDPRREFGPVRRRGGEGRVALGFGDRFLHRSMGLVHDSHRTPHRAVLLCGGLLAAATWLCCRRAC
jgi:hypothetical protein